MSVVNAIPLIAAGDDGYSISRSLRFRSSASASLTRTPATASNRKTFTWSGWVKRGTLSTYQNVFGATTGGYQFLLRFDNDNTLFVYQDGVADYGGNTSAVYRDPAAWYHIVLAIDTTQATDTNRLKLYVNGVQVSVNPIYGYFALNVDTSINSTGVHSIGGPSANYFDGYMAEVNFIDGQALAPTAFGTFNSYGVWQPITYGGSYGTNGFRLPFTNNASTTTLGYDFSPQGNNWTTNNISVTAGSTYDSMTDVPTLTSLTAANYAVLNPLDTLVNTLTNGNLYLSTTSASYGGSRASIAIPTTGKWYWETTVSTQTGAAGDWVVAGMGLSTVALNSFIGDVAGSIFYGDRNDLAFIFNETTTVTSGGSIFVVTGDVMQCAYDASTGKFWFGKNDTWWSSAGAGTGNPSAGTNNTLTAAAGTYFPFGQVRSGGGALNAISLNFGQRPFAYTPPTGFKALNTQNLPDSTIKKGGQYFDATTFTSTGTTQAVTNSGFQPDLLWFKRRDTANNHFMFNSVVGDDKYLVPNLTDAEATSAASISSLNSNGFTMGTNNYANTSSVVCWNWKAGGTAVSNTAGSITSSVSANPTAGFSVVTWTGTGSNATVGHGLGVAPAFIIGKKRSAAGSWQTYVSAIPNMATGYIVLNGTGAWTSNSTIWNGTAPTSTVFSLGTDTDLNANGATNVAYCFAPVAGYSAFGKYTGDGSADGPFVYTGFRPRFIMIKRSDAVGNWEVLDSSRNPSNAANFALYPNLSNAENTSPTDDFLSNGFKIRTATDSNQNTNGGTYIYMAFAENPFKYANAR